jgi:hypothetical protein
MVVILAELVLGLVGILAHGALHLIPVLGPLLSDIVGLII